MSHAGGGWSEAAAEPESVMWSIMGRSFDQRTYVLKSVTSGVTSKIPLECWGQSAGPIALVGPLFDR